MTWFDDQDADERRRLSELLEDPRAQHVRRYAGNNRGFGCWLLVAEARCKTDLGVSIFDLADMTWAVWFEEGIAPIEALMRALRAEGYIS